MSLEASPTEILNNLAGALVAKHTYATAEEALWELAFSAVRSKIAHYRRRIRRFERKYSSDLDTFTAHLQDKATPDQEDDWLAWRSARGMLADWEKTYRDLLNERPR